jgi:hypothetical protein
MEVRAPHSSYRIDVAAVRVDRGSAAVSTVAIFECKQSRSDLVRDNRRVEKLKHLLKHLQDRRTKLEALLATHYPSLKTSDCLFPEWASFDFSSIDHKGYRQTIQKLARVQRQLTRNIKFDLVTRYRLGNLHYLVTPVGMIDPSELPLGWGLLEADSDGGTSEKTLPTRFSQTAIIDWLVQIGKASTTREIRAVLEGRYLRRPVGGAGPPLGWTTDVAPMP